MHLLGEEERRKSRCGVTIWDREDKKTSSGKKSITFTVEDTTMEELEEFFKKCVRNYDAVIKVIGPKA